MKEVIQRKTLWVELTPDEFKKTNPNDRIVLNQLVRLAHINNCNELYSYTYIYSKIYRYRKCNFVSSRTFVNILKILHTLGFITISKTKKYSMISLSKYLNADGSFKTADEKTTSTTIINNDKDRIKELEEQVSILMNEIKRLSDSDKDIRVDDKELTDEPKNEPDDDYNDEEYTGWSLEKEIYDNDVRYQMERKLLELMRNCLDWSTAISPQDNLTDEDYRSRMMKWWNDRGVIDWYDKCKGDMKLFIEMIELDDKNISKRLSGATIKIECLDEVL